MLNGLGLFEGIAGLTMALQDWIKPVAYCEIDPYATAVLLSRMQDGLLPIAPVWDDVSTLRRKEIQCRVDAIYGGFPCQDISFAGAGAGLEGERSGLYWQVHRLVGDLRPEWVFLENVPAITHRGGREVAASLAALRYDCRWGMLSAYDVGAPHHRERWWLLAHANSQLHGHRDFEPKSLLQKRVETQRHEIYRGTWGVEPDMGRVAYGVPYRVDRVKALGNSVVPEQAREAFMKLAGLC